jgi:hypothetical protein
MIKSLRMTSMGQVAHIREMRNVYKILIREPEGQPTLVRYRRKWEYNIKMDLTELCCGVGSGFDCLRIGAGGGLL